MVFDENKAENVLMAGKSLVEMVPVYQDLAQPAMKELSKGLLVAAKAVNAALSPIGALVWGYDQIKDFVNTKVAEKLKDTAPEDIITPQAHVAGPLMEALKYTGPEESLRDLYANLLASAMDQKTAEGAFPCFVEIIKQMTSDEAKIMDTLSKIGNAALIDIQLHFAGEKRGYLIKVVNYSHLGQDAGCEYPKLTPKYIDNLCRLGLTEIPYGRRPVDEERYKALEVDAYVRQTIEDIEKSSERKGRTDRKLLVLTELGKLFIDVCVVSKTQTIHSTVSSA